MDGWLVGCSSLSSFVVCLLSFVVCLLSFVVCRLSFVVCRCCRRRSLVRWLVVSCKGIKAMNRSFVVRRSSFVDTVVVVVRRRCSLFVRHGRGRSRSRCCGGCSLLSLFVDRGCCSVLLSVVVVRCGLWLCVVCCVLLSSALFVVCCVLVPNHNSTDSCISSLPPVLSDSWRSLYVNWWCVQQSLPSSFW